MRPNSIRKGTLAEMFSCECWEISKNPFSYTTPPVHNPSKHFLVLKTSSRRLQDMSWRRPQRNSFTSYKTCWRRLEDVLKDVKLLRWRRLPDVLKTCLEDVFKSLERVLKTCLEDIYWRCLEDMSWRRLENILEKNKILTGDICILIWG